MYGIERRLASYYSIAIRFHMDGVAACWYCCWCWWRLRWWWIYYIYTVQQYSRVYERINVYFYVMYVLYYRNRNAHSEPSLLLLLGEMEKEKWDTKLNPIGWKSLSNVYVIKKATTIFGALELFHTRCRIYTYSTYIFVYT